MVVANVGMASSVSLTTIGALLILAIPTYGVIRVFASNTSGSEATTISASASP